VEAREATDEEAKLLVEALDAVPRKKVGETLKVLESWKGIRHALLFKPLVKLMKHEDGDVALAAVRLLEHQRPRDPDEKAAAKASDKALREIWKTAFAQSVNDSRHDVKGAVVQVFGAWGTTLDARQFDEVESLWRASTGNPEARRVAALVSVVRYVEAVKDKRFSRRLAEQIDEPRPGDVNSPDNPPASYWEAKWKAWKELADPVHRALKALTGQDFKSMDEAKKWFKANEKEYGFRW
jgi:hypothetical protein